MRSEASRRPRTPACLILALVALAACAKKPDAAAPAAPPAANSESVKELGIGFTPPAGWKKMDDALMASARELAKGQKQIGCYDASPVAAFYGPDREQVIVSGLKPNADYDRGQSAVSQMGRHAGILKLYFSASGRVVGDKILINGYTVFRITGKDETEYFSKYLFIDPTDAAPPFCVDVVEPLTAYSEATNDEIGKSLRSFRKE